MSGKMPLALSTVECPPGGQAGAGIVPCFRAATRNKTQFALLTVDPAVAAIEAARKRRGLSHYQLIAAARVHPSTWYYLRHGQQQARPATIKRLADAVAAAPVAKLPPPAPLKALVNATAALIARALAGNAALIAAVNPRKGGLASSALQPRRIRSIAVYLLAVEIEIGNADIARALGCSRMNVKQVRDDIHELRDDGGPVDALFDGVVVALKGEAA